MTAEKIKTEIIDLLKEANPKINIKSDDIDMFSSSIGIEPRDLLFVCMELKKKYPIDYNKVVDTVDTFTLNKFSQSIISQI